MGRGRGLRRRVAIASHEHEVAMTSDRAVASPRGMGQPILIEDLPFSLGLASHCMPLVKLAFISGPD